MNDKDLRTMWEGLANKILASILIDHGSIFAVIDVLGNDRRLFPDRQGKIWTSIIECIDNETLPTVEAVAVRLNGSVEHGFIQSIANQWNEEDNRRIIYHAEELRQLGLLHQLRILGGDLAQADDPVNIKDTIGDIEVKLAGLKARTTQRQSDALSVSTTAWDEVDSFVGDNIPTGLKWFDNLTGGLWLGMNYWIAAAYKQGKTTLLRNITLSCCLNSIPVDIFCAEGTRELFTLDCQAMLATKMLIERAIPVDKLRLSGLFIKRTWRQGNLLTKDEYECIQEARLAWEKYSIQLWDSKDGIKDTMTMRYRIKQSKIEHGVKVVGADYSQLFGTGGTLFERQSSVALAIPDIAVNENVAILMLTQKNEEAIRNPNNYSIGVKGGGDASAAADFMIVPSFDPELKNMLTVELKYSRHTSSGKNSHVIDPSSGLILE